MLRCLKIRQLLEARAQTVQGFGVSGAMDYQQKLAEKLVILNERGNGVLVRMNYIKKVSESKWVSDKKKELDLIHQETNQNVSFIEHKTNF